MVCTKIRSAALKIPKVVILVFARTALLGITSSDISCYPNWYICIRRNEV